MIRTEWDRTELKGSDCTILAEFGATAGCIKQMLMENGYSEEKAKEKIMDAVEFGLKSEEEMEAFAEEKMKEFAERIAKDLFNRILRP